MMTSVWEELHVLLGRAPGCEWVMARLPAYEAWDLSLTPHEFTAIHKHLHDCAACAAEYKQTVEVVFLAPGAAEPVSQPHIDPEATADCALAEISNAEFDRAPCQDRLTCLFVVLRDDRASTALIISRYITPYLCFCVALGVAFLVSFLPARAFCEDRWRMDYLSQRERPRPVRKDNYCGAYAVSHVLRLSARPKSLPQIMSDLQFGPSDDGCTVSQMVEALKVNGVPVRVVEMPVAGLGVIEHPTIVFVKGPRAEEEAPGHFLVYVPQTESSGLMLDGTREPKRIDLAALREQADLDIVVLLPTSSEEQGSWLVSTAASGMTGLLLGLAILWLSKLGEPARIEKALPVREASRSP